jgi:hypothetical protein
VKYIVTARRKNGELLYVVRYTEAFKLWDLCACSESLARKFASKAQAAACIAEASARWKGLSDWTIEPALPQTPEEIAEIEKEIPQGYASPEEMENFRKKLRALKP